MTYTIAPQASGSKLSKLASESYDMPQEHAKMHAAKWRSKIISVMPFLSPELHHVLAR